TERAEQPSSRHLQDVVLWFSLGSTQIAPGVSTELEHVQRFVDDYSGGSVSGEEQVIHVLCQVDTLRTRLCRRRIRSTRGFADSRARRKMRWGTGACANEDPARLVRL